MLSNLRFAFHQWREHPASTVLAALILGLGMRGLTAVFRVAATGPRAFAGILLVHGLAVGVACSLPARRAARVDPMQALRCK